MSVVYSRPPRVVIGHITVSIDGRHVPLGAPVRQRHADAALDLIGQVDEHGTAVFFDEETYGAAHRLWAPVAADDDADERSKAFATWIEQIRKIVWGTGAAEPELPWANSRPSDPDPAAEVETLRPQQVAGNVLVYESASLFRSLIGSGSLDRLHLTVLPEVVGSGAALFDGRVAPSEWRLTSVWPSTSTAITLVYDHVTR